MRYNGIVQNAKALTYDQMFTARQKVIDYEKYIMCISPENKLTLLSPKPITSDLFDLAWEQFEYINNGGLAGMVYADIYDHAGNFLGIFHVSGNAEPV